MLLISFEEDHTVLLFRFCAILKLGIFLFIRGIVGAEIDLTTC